MYLATDYERSAADADFTRDRRFSAAQAADPRHCNKLYELCGDDPDICYAQLLACLER